MNFLTNGNDNGIKTTGVRDAAPLVVPYTNPADNKVTDLNSYKEAVSLWKMAQKIGQRKTFQQIYEACWIFNHESKAKVLQNKTQGQAGSVHSQNAQAR